MYSKQGFELVGTGRGNPTIYLGSLAVMGSVKTVFDFNVKETYINSEERNQKKMKKKKKLTKIPFVFSSPWCSLQFASLNLQVSF